MRISNGSSIVAAFGILVGLIGTPEGPWAQDGAPEPPLAEPVAIEIIGNPVEEPAVDMAEPTSDAAAKPVDGVAPEQLAPLFDLPLAATASIEPQEAAGIVVPENWGTVDPFVGSFSTAVSIAVPGYHGIAPNLALTYNSSRGNGLVGLGWELSGASIIERSGPNKGSPRYDGGDVFVLDGTDLVVCTAGMASPSCATGGTHATEVESYTRIVHDPTANTWTWTSPDGTVRVYSAILGHDLAASTGTFRWGRTADTDTHGNHVGYTWWCDGANDCYLDTVAYNGVTVTLYRGARPDPMVSAKGNGLVHTNYRLKTIDVQVGGERLRAYALAYGTSETAGQSRLESVTQYGHDAVLDPTTGAVTGGTALPPSNFAWPAEASGAVTTVGWGRPCGYVRGMADFNGDGKDDVLCVDGGNYGIALSNGDGTFSTVRTWSANWCGGVLRFADFNGDGMDDIHCTTTSTGIGLGGGDPTVRKAIALSNGDGTVSVVLSNDDWCTRDGSAYDGEISGGDFNGDGRFDRLCREFTEKWGGFGGGGDPRDITVGRIGLAAANGTFSYVNLGTLCNDHVEVIVGDFDGDARTDLYCADSQGKTWLSNGNGTFRLVYSLRFCDRSNGGAADFNGDGRDDLYCQGETFNPRGSGQPNGVITIATSTGNGGFVQTTTSASICGPYASSYHWGLTPADLNGDGLTDVACRHGYENIPAFSRGDGSFSAQPQWNWCGNMNATDQVRTADIDGDGKRDFLCLYGGNADLAISSGSQPGLMTSTEGPLGGKVAVDYTPSSAWDNGYLPMIVQTVSALTTDDGRGGVSTTSYAYEGGFWHHGERRFLGFREATTTLPCIAGETACPHTESTFRQDLASAGRLEQLDQFDGAGTLLTRGLEEYVVNDTTAPYTALNTASESRVIVGAVTRRTRTTRSFDDYANVVEETAHGDADVIGDEITSVTDFNPNTGDYIVSLPARVRSFDGAGTAGALLTESRILYDGATDWATPPVRGDPTETQEWLDTEARFISAQAEYDSRGNVTATIDPLGRRSEIDYDPVYHLYPIAARNPLYFPPASDTRHQTSTIWDTVCGVPTVSTDLNGNTTTTQYDALCRPIRTDLPDGGFAITSYNAIGDPTAQYVETQTPPADGSGNIWSRTYMDGFARPYRSTAKGPVAGQDITADTAYDDRGNVASQTAPYYTGDPVYTTTFDYDALDRPVATNHPDGNWTQTDYGVAGVFVSTTSTDELGHPVTLHLDAFGRAVRKEEPLGAATVKTDYTYDDLGRLTGIADDVENSWSYTHDSLGRTLTVDDPDLGVWTKTYDDAGQLETQTDALGQVTRFTHDALGRMLTKTARDGTAQAELTTYTYDEAVAGFHNTGLLTRAENPSGILRYRYDQLGREAQRIYTIDGSDFTLASGFDIAGRLIWQDYPDGDTVGSALDPITYDAASRLDAVPGLVTSATYDASGNADVFTRANGVVSTYGYSLTRGWLDSVVTTSGATSIQNMSYGRDDAGQITAVTSTFTDESWTYAYDALRRLLTATNTDNSAHSRTYTYDSIGNMLTNSGVTGTYSYPAAGSARPHAVTSVGSWTYAYDANGNMTAGAGRTYTYSGENRPTQIDTQAYTYGPDGERWKTVDSAPGGGTTLYLGGSIEIAAGVMTKYLPGSAKRVGSPGDPLVETFWLHHDHQGSIQAITDAAGIEVQRFMYYPYGDRIATATAHEESKGWIGERQDATGLFYLHARYYDPVIGRFNSADPSDPMRPGVGLNRYAYAGNNPVMRIDPWGLKFIGNDESGGRGTTKYTDRKWHGSMSPREAKWRSRSPSAIVRRNVIRQFEKQQAIGSYNRNNYSKHKFASGPQLQLTANMALIDPANRPRTLEEWLDVLGIVGLAPVAGEWADLASAAIYGIQGDELNAGLSLGSAVPFAGWGAAGAKWARRLGLICSFAEGTPVLTPSGNVPIEMLEIGDMVLARDELTYEEDWREVTATFAHHHEFVLVLTTKGIDGSRSQITTTSNHPFHIQGRGWVLAGELVVGDVVSAANGNATLVVGVATVAEPQIAYNLEVEDFHTFFAGNHQEWVHNGFCGGVVAGTRGLQHSFDRHAAEWFGGEVSRTRHMAEWQALIERAAGSRRQVEWMTGNDPTIGHLARIGDKDFFVQFYTEGDRAGELATAFVPNQRELSRILRQLSGN